MKRRGVWLLVWLLAAGVPCAAEVTDWHLYPPDCQGGVAALEIKCGSIGRYLVNQDPNSPPSCTEIRRGGPGAELYPPNEDSGPPFHTRAPRLGEELVTLSSTKQKGPGLKALIVPGPSLDWISVLDFNNRHGDGTTWVVDQVAGPDVSAKLVPLDRPGFAAVLGDEVGDFHVLAAVCAVAEEVRVGNVPMPRAVNMSFGRHAHSEDPGSAAACPAPPALQTAACEIARAVAQLTQQGTWFVSAAGNHGAPLFPGSLQEVISAGMLDLTRFFDDGSTAPAWETPPNADALIPGNALCMGSSAAPAGSSYSSAVLAGWIARLVKYGNPLLTQGGGSTWVPVYNSSPTKQCWTLGKALLNQSPAPPPTASPYCNATITEMLDALSGTSAPCWNAATAPMATVAAVLHGDPRQGVDPLDGHFVLGTHPTPESDPCVPCSGHMVASDLHIDLSQSEPLPSWMALDEVGVRVDGTFLKLGLSPDDLTKMTTGDLAVLEVTDMETWVSSAVSLSVWYRMRPVEESCEVEENCFWSSTPLLLDK
ncbi:MAG TPA: hypothetical protein VFO11_11050 [Candidatus Polarisedimenticolaceae bacterium]|nr:hypothetical protein [Candidatus Polarisedimenticolaceae bacterium]